MILWKNGFARVVGASEVADTYSCSTAIIEKDFDDDSVIGATVPKVVKYV